MDRREFIKNCAVTGLGALGLGQLAALWPGQPRAGAAHAPQQQPLRPPGALPEDEFLARCIRCQRCADACPNNAILPADESCAPAARLTPLIKARRQACMLCNGIEGDYLKCTAACPTGALQRIRKDPDEIRRRVAMGTAEIDLALCYSYNGWSCGACARACPLPGVAIRLGMWERPEVVAEACIGCGACERACIRYPHAVRVRPRGATT